MRKIEKVHLYVEKYDRYKQELLLDFICEDEFFYFKNRGDYVSKTHRFGNDYEPTMLLIYGCFPKKTPRNGSVLSLNMNSLLEIYHERDLNTTHEHPATVFMEIQNGEYFANLIDSSDNYPKSSHIRNESIVHLTSTEDVRPCALDFLEEEFKICVWNVGQGNTNCVSSKTNLTLFDFGSSFYYSKSKQESIIESHMSYIKKHEIVSLIISHWDIDHYNLLCVAPDDFLQNLSCVFYPAEGIGLTMKQVAARIERNCSFREAIKSPLPKEHKSGIVWVHKGNRFILFTGEKSTSKNLSGLLLTVYNDKTTVFLTADHSNYQIWDQLCNEICFNPSLLHVVVPHHGGNRGDFKIPLGFFPGIAGVSVGSNIYGHPNSNTISLYRKKGFEVIQTDRSGQDIIIKIR